MQIQGRTVRFYISNGLLPPPSGGPKYARYGIEHLLRIVAIRRWLDTGLTLDQAGEKIKLGEHGGETETVQRRSNLLMETVSPMFAPIRTSSEDLVRRIRLTPHSVLEIAAEADLKTELDRVIEGVRRQKEKINDI
ncbi:MAG: MerR family transcriptional regulator [Armatimonadetes bacterium]|nr:MerR family transcriptional regulator [Armatimonadota bacterium]